MSRIQRKQNEIHVAFTHVLYTGKLLLYLQYCRIGQRFIFFFKIKGGHRIWLCTLRFIKYQMFGIVLLEIVHCFLYNLHSYTIFVLYKPSPTTCFFVQ